MRNNTKIMLSILAISSLAMAEDINFDETNKLITHTEFGYTSTEGNTQTKTYALDSKIKKGFDKHLLCLNFDGQYAEDKDIATKDKYTVELSYDYKLTNKLALNYLISYKDDKFSGYNYQAYTGPGFTYEALSIKNHNLSMDGNILYSQDDFEDVNYDASGNAIAFPNAANTPTASKVKGQTQDYTSFRAKTSYDWQILEDLKFNQEISYRTEFEDTKNYFVFSKTAFSSKVSDILSAGISYKVDYANITADGKESTDKTLTATLTIDY